MYPDGCTFSFEAPRFRRMKKTPRMVKQITVSPPKTPPTIGPMLFGLCSEDSGVGFDVDGGNEAPDRTLALEGAVVVEDGGIEVCVAGVKLSKGPLRSVDVVVATASFGVTKMLSVFGSLPQAMYDND